MGETYAPGNWSRHLLHSKCATSTVETACLSAPEPHTYPNLMLYFLTYPSDIVLHYFITGGSMAVTSKPASTIENLVAGWLTTEEFSILETVCDTLLPSLEPLAGSSDEVSAYYRRSGRDLKVALLMAETLATENTQEQAKFRRLLAL